MPDLYEEMRTRELESGCVALSNEVQRLKRLVADLEEEIIRLKSVLESGD